MASPENGFSGFLVCAARGERNRSGPRRCARCASRVVARAAAVTVACLSLVSPALAQDTSDLSFAQLTGSDGCVRALGALAFDFGGDPLAGCDTASGLGNPQALLVSPDQRQLLVAAGGGDEGSNALVTLSRAPSNGALSFASCASNDGGDGRLGSDGVCSDVDGISSPDALAVTPDGRWLYATSRTSSSLTWFERDPISGALTQRGCLKSYALIGERCITAPLLGGADGVVVSPDGRWVFVAAARSGAVSAYQRDPANGQVTRVSCVSDTGSDGLCENAAGLRGVADLTMTPDGRKLLAVAPKVGAVDEFDVSDDGALKEHACFGDPVAGGGQCTEVPSLGGAASAVLSADGLDLYIGATGDAALTSFRRQPDGSFMVTGCSVFQSPQRGDTTDQSDYYDDESTPEDNGTTSCTPVRALDPAQLALAADGRALFAAGDDYLDAFRRDPATGQLQWVACAEQDPTYRSCVSARGLPGASAIATSGDGRNLYVASNASHSVAVFGAAVAVGARATVRRDGRVRFAVSCPVARPLPCRGTLRHRLLAAPLRYGLAPGRRRLLSSWLRPRTGPHGRRQRSMTLAATDATGLTRTALYRVTLAAR
jgi:6-phosphogluconolactonase (cycloisomerase 2 family)